MRRYGRYRGVRFGGNLRDGYFDLPTKYAIAKYLIMAKQNLLEKEYWLKQYSNKNPADSADVRDFLADMANLKRKIEQLMKESNSLEKEIGDWVNDGWKGL